MNTPIMTQAALETWLTNLLPAYDVIAPQQQGAQIVFAPVNQAFAQQIAGASDIAWNAGRTDLSAKEYFLPASEAIITLRPGVFA